MTNIRNVRRNIVIRYAAPALEKGLDVLELLASEAHNLSLQEIAARVSIPATRGALKRTTVSILRSLGWLGRASA